MSYRQASLDTINAALLYVRDLGDRWPNLGWDEFYVLSWRLVPPYLISLSVNSRIANELNATTREPPSTEGYT